ncbi:MAG: nitrilase-related carbon-nitrogen hydrolase [Betaproteobacteria bacterium]
MGRVVKVAAANLGVARLWRHEPGTNRSERPAVEARAELLELADQAAAEGAELLLFPALSGMLLTPEGVKAVRTWAEGRALKVEPAVAEGWVEAATGFTADLARRRRLYVAVSLLQVEAEGGFRHEAAVYGPDGTLLGRQAQTHAFRREAAAGLRPSCGLSVIETRLGRLGLVIGSDAWYPEVSRILALSGAEILLFPEAVRSPYPLWRQVAGAWQEVQQNQVFGLESGLAGWGFVGRAAVFGPCELTPGQTGQLAGVGPAYSTVDNLRPFAADSKALHEKGLAVAALDFDRLAEVQRKYPILTMLNPDAYQAYFPAVYEASSREGGTP